MTVNVTCVVRRGETYAHEWAVQAPKSFYCKWCLESLYGDALKSWRAEIEEHGYPILAA